MRWKIVNVKPQEKKFCVRAMISELSWRQIIAQIFNITCCYTLGKKDQVFTLSEEADHSFNLKTI